MPGQQTQLPPGGAPLTPRMVRRVSIVCFLAWVFSVFDYTLFGTLLPEIAKDFDWSSATSTGVATWVTTGTFVVSLAVGPMLDRFGRKPSLMITAAGAALTSGLTALVGGRVSTVIIRSFSGLGYSEEVVNSAYLNEAYGKNAKRGFMYSFVQSGWPVGALLGALVTSGFLHLIGWRGVFLFATFPAVVIVLLAARVPESPAFVNLRHVRKLRADGRIEEADAVAAEAGISDERAGTLRDVLAPGLRMHTICLAAAWLFNWIAIQIFSVLGTTVLTEAKGVSFDNALLVLILANAAGFTGYLFHGWLGDRIGRRKTIIIGWFIDAVVMTAMLLGPDSAGYVIPLYSAGLFFLTGPYAALLFYMGESFPVHVRGIGPNTAHIMGPIGAIVGSAALTALIGAGATMTTAALCAGCVGLVCSVAVMFGTRRTAQDRAPGAAETSPPSASDHSSVPKESA